LANPDPALGNNGESVKQILATPLEFLTYDFGFVGV